MTDEGLNRVCQFLTDELGAEVDAALVYGSVARGDQSADSDLDCFVLLAAEPGAAARHRIGRRFAELQQELGYRADNNYPIELFTLDVCQGILADPATRDLVDMVAAGCPVNERVRDGDAAELLRALLGQRIVLISSDSLRGLSRLAATMLPSAPEARKRVLRTMHVTRPEGSVLDDLG